MAAAVEKAKEHLTAEEFALCSKLATSLNQAHLFEPWTSGAVDDTGKKALAAQLLSLDKEYTDGGLAGYIKNAKKLLADSAKGVNPFADWKPAVPTGQAFTLGTDEYDETEKIGLAEMGRIGFVLVAGGLGERLGYGDIKIGLPTEMSTETKYIQYYIEYILAVQNRFATMNGEVITKLPLCIMTSNDTHQKTVDLLEANNYYGMEKEQITFVTQGQGVPALADNEARFVLDGDNPSRLSTKPHGHGDIHALLYNKAVAKTWKKNGIKWLCLFQDTNGLAFHTLPVMLGVSAKMNLIMNSLAVPRQAKQAIGAITKLTNTKTGEERTINVEYNQLDPMLRANGYENGDENDESGCSPFPGNINQLLFQLDDYAAILEKTKGLMPEFVNPKYKDETKTVFKKPTRLECMMQDFPTVIGKDGARVGFTSIAAELCFSPVKNATADGVKLQASGKAAATAATGEADQYAAQRKMMQAIGCSVNDSAEKTYMGIKVVPGPAIVLKPDFVLCYADYKKKFPEPEKIKITSRSSLCVRGSNVTIRGLTLDGALLIDGPKDREIEVVDLVIKNKGWTRIIVPDTTPDVKEIIKMRGYRVDRKETKVIAKPSDLARAVAGEPKEINFCSFM